jgi:hypothetical protein
VNAGAKKVKTLLENPIRHFYRPARNGDIVPTIPLVVGLRIYKHLDIGYKLDPENQDGNFITVRASEIDKDPINDDVPSPPNAWMYHCRAFYYLIPYMKMLTNILRTGPEMYYEGIEKVLSKYKD